MYRTQKDIRIVRVDAAGFARPAATSFDMDTSQEVDGAAGGRAVAQLGCTGDAWWGASARGEGASSPEVGFERFFSGDEAVWDDDGRAGFDVDKGLRGRFGEADGTWWARDLRE